MRKHAGLPAVTSSVAELSGGAAQGAPLPPRSVGAGEEGTGVGDVLADLGDEGLDGVVAALVTQADDEIEGEALAVEVAGEIEGIGLHPAFPAGEGGVGADRRGGGQPGAVAATDQPGRVDAVGGHGG